MRGKLMIYNRCTCSIDKDETPVLDVAFRDHDIAFAAFVAFAAFAHINPSVKNSKKATELTSRRSASESTNTI